MKESHSKKKEPSYPYHKRVVILGIDTFRKKNVSQIELMGKQGYIFDVFTNDTLEDSFQQFHLLKQTNKLLKLKSKFFPRATQLILYFLKYRKQICHAEVYAAGRFALFYSAICLVFRVKYIVIERGDLQGIMAMPFFPKLAFQLIYKFADIVWYKEPYMAALLEQFGVQSIKMIPNAAGVQVNTQSTQKDIDFLWVNRTIFERRFDWFIQFFHDKTGVRTAALGYSEVYRRDHLLPDTRNLLDKLKNEAYFEMYGYVAPEPFYLRSRFFVLPATIVFGNYSLLEAMSYGLVPIVSETEVTDKIVQNNINGLTFRHDFGSFSAAIERAINMDEATYQLMSDNAKKTIEQAFSLNQWADNVTSLYSELQTS